MLYICQPRLKAYMLPTLCVMELWDVQCSVSRFVLAVCLKIRTEVGKTAFRFAAPSAWNMIENTLKQNELVSLNTLRGNQMTWRQKHLAVDVFYYCS